MYIYSLPLQFAFSMTLLWIGLGYYIYGGVNGAFAMLVLAILYNLATWIAFVPFAGIGIQYVVMSELILPWVKNLTGIETTWLTDFMFRFNLIIGLIVWIIITLKAFALIDDYHRKRNHARKKTDE